MSDEQAQEEVAEEVQEEVVETVENVTDDTPQEEAETPEEAPVDMVAEAQKANEALKAELEALKNSDTNIFEQNEILKKELEDAKKLAEMAEENKALQGQLEAIKKNSLIEGMVASGQITNDLKEWASGMNFDQLQTFAGSAPKVKTILEEKNPVDNTDETMEEWKKKQQKSRIL